MTSAARALRPAARRVVLRHSALTRICYWINTICFFALLMSGL
jgi:cytochrome b subunit of formate dehydrogenase